MVGRVGRADQKVVAAVAVHIAAAGRGPTGMVAGALPLNAKAGRAADIAQVKLGGEGGPAQENVDGPCLGGCGARRAIGGDEGVVVAVAVHIAGRAHGVAGIALGGDTIDGDAVGAVQIGQTELRREGRAAEDDVGAAGV